MKFYDEKTGVRLTDCCRAYSTFMEVVQGGDALCCKACFNEVPTGQGDGSEHKPENPND